MTAARPAAGRRAALTVVLAVVIVAVPLGIYLWGRTSDSFDVRRVVITGEERLPEREVQRLLTARFVGENLFTVGADDVRQTLSRYPYVADVKVDRDFPDTLRIRLSEHDPAALVLANGAWYVVSSRGRVLAQLDAVGPAANAAAGQGSQGSPAPAATPATSAGRADTLGSPSPVASPSRIGPVPVPSRTIVPRDMRRLPLIATEAETVTVGETVDDDKVIAGLRLLAALPRTLRRRVGAVDVGLTSAKAFTRDGLAVEFGVVDDLDAKILALEAVLRRYAQRRLHPTVVDVSVPARPLASPLLPTPGTE